MSSPGLPRHRSVGVGGRREGVGGREEGVGVREEGGREGGVREEGWEGGRCERVLAAHDSPVSYF